MPRKAISKKYHPGRNDYKRIPWKFSFVVIFVIITKIIPPEHFLCNVAATGLSLFARSCEGICFVKRLFCNVYKINCAKQLILKSIFCNNFGCVGMDQYRSRLKLSENFERHWSIRFSGEIHMDQSLVHTFSWEKLYGPMVLKVLREFPPCTGIGPWMALPGVRELSGKESGISSGAPFLNGFV